MTVGVVSHVSGFGLAPKQLKRTWIACPRCIGGSMYPESRREHVCMQCGYHLYHGNKKTGSEIPVVVNRIPGMRPRLAICVNRED